MAIDLIDLGQKIRNYRNQLEIGQAEFSENTNIAMARLEGIESGAIGPTGDEILIIADYLKCDYKFFLSKEQVAPFDQTNILFRKYGPNFTKDDRRSIQEFLYLCECEEYLINCLRPSTKSTFAFNTTGTYYKAHGVQAANALRKFIGRTEQQVGANLYEELRGIGLHIFRRQLKNSAISGLFMRHPSAGKCILVNYQEDVYRQRFTVAHEACHALLDADEEVVVSFTNWNRDDLIEIRANTFAASYLIPPDLLKAVSSNISWTKEAAIEWASRFKVSTTMLANSLVENKLIDRETKKLISSVSVPQDKKQDPELPSSLSANSLVRKTAALKRGLSDHYIRLCMDGYYNSIISAGKLAEMLLTTPAQLAPLLRLFGMELRHAQ